MATQLTMYLTTIYINFNDLIEMSDIKNLHNTRWLFMYIVWQYLSKEHICLKIFTKLFKYKYNYKIHASLEMP